jgi:sec-independent protein translocase protein TatC
MESITSNDEFQEAKMSFIEHLRELRTRLMSSIIGLVLAFIVTLIYYDPIVKLFLDPFRVATGGQDMINVAIFAGFQMMIRISLYSALVVSFPLHLYNIIAFITPALRASEKRTLLWVLIVSGLLIAFGGFMGYRVVLPISIEFLNTFAPAGVQTTLDFKTNIMLPLQLTLGFMVLFQLPLLLLLLMKFDILKRKHLVKFWRYILVLIFILAALVTPPDPTSQLLLAVPLSLLFFATILAAKILGFGESEDEETD